MKVFRRGCLKGLPYVLLEAILCKCEMIFVDCINCNRGGVALAFARAMIA